MSSGFDGSLKFDTKIDTSGFEKGVKETERTAHSFGSGISKIFTVSGAAAGAGLAAAVKNGADFEAQMSTVGAISLATADDMEVLSAKAKEMGIKTVFSASQAGEAMEYMAMAGWKTEDMLGGIEGIMNLAAASGENLGDVSDIVTDALTAFGMKANESGRFADVLAAASSNANTNVGMMGETFKYVAPVAGAMGFSIEDTAAAIGLMANSGIKATQAGTSLRQIFSRLAKPPKDAAKAMSALNLTITKSDGSFKSLGEITQELRQKFSKLTAEQKTQYAAALGGQEAMSALLAIVNAAPEDVEKLTSAIKDSNGAAKEMSEIKLDNLKGQLTLMGSAAEGLGIAIYEGIEGPLKNAVKNSSGMISELAASFTSGELKEPLQRIGELLGSTLEGGIRLASDAIPGLISGFQSVASMAQPLIVIFSGIASAVVGYKLAVGGAAAVTSAFSMAATALTNPIGLIGTAAGLTVWGLVKLHSAIEGAKDRFYNMGDALDTSAQKFQNAKEKANLTDDYAAKWRDLNEAISDGSLSGQKLKDAESQRKDIEDWFIQNYGKYISAEEAKNGVREETIDKLQEMVKLQSDSQRMELENQILSTKLKLPDLTKSIQDLKSSNAELDGQNTRMLTNVNCILKAQNAWKEQSASITDVNKRKELYAKLTDEVNKKLGTSFSSLGEATAKTEDYRKAIEWNNKTIEENNSKISDAEGSLQSYSDACRTLIEDKLGDTLQGFSDKFNILKKAQDEITQSGKISAETYDELAKKFPELKDSLASAEDAPQAVADKMVELQAKLDEARSKAADLGSELNGLPKNISIDVKLNVPNIPQFARGTKGAKEGIAVVNDGNGAELIQSKDGSMRMVSSRGAAMTWINRGDRVYTAEQTKRMLKNVPHYAGGVGNTAYSGEVKITSYIDKLPGAFEKAFDEINLRRDLDVLSEEDYYSELSALRDKYLTKSSDKWWEYTKDIVTYQKKAAEQVRDNEFKTLERRLNRNIITEDEYYSELERLRDKYYESGSDEYESYTDRLYQYRKSVADKARESEFNALDKQLSRQIISEEEYYTRLENLRDKYFKEGSDEWQDYTDRIIDYNMSKINNLKNTMLAGLKAFSSETVTHKKLGGSRTQIAGRPLDPTSADWTESKVNLANIKSYRENMEMYYKAIKELADTGLLTDSFYDYLLSQSMDEGYGLASELLKLSTDDLKEFINDWQAVEDLAPKQAENLINKTADNLYSDDTKESVTQAAENMGGDFVSTLSKYFDDIPESYYNIGKNSAWSFADGFKGAIDSALYSINAALAKGFSGKNVSNSYTDNSSLTVIAGSQSEHGIIDAYNQNKVYNKHVRGW